MISGFKDYRLIKDDPYYEEEVKFNELFNREDEKDNWDVIIFGNKDVNHPPNDTLSEREKKIIAGVIQWLGTPVGNSFLRDAGYLRKK